MAFICQPKSFLWMLYALWLGSN